MLLFTLILMVPMLHIAYTDIKNYNVSVLSLIITAFIGVVRFFYIVASAERLLFFTSNTLFILILFAVLFLYTQIRKISFIKNFAWGDILFLCLIVVILSPVNCVFFIVLSSLIGTIHYLVKNKKRNAIPFAGIMASLLNGMFFVELITPFSTFSDQWILSLLIK